VDDEGACIRKRRVMAHSEPDFQVSEGAVPAEDLNYNWKGESGNMKDFHNRIPDTGNRSDDQKDDPEEMNEDDTIS